MRLFTSILIALLAINMPAIAQFKCETKGKTSFQDTPCETTAQSSKLKDWSGAAPGPAAATPGIATCQAALLSSQGFFDPGSVQIHSTTKAGTEVITYAGAPIIARKFTMMVNAKNRYGGYVGIKAYSCFTSEDEMRLLAIK